MLPAASMHSIVTFLIIMQTHVPNKAFVWKNQRNSFLAIAGARYFQAMSFFLIPDIPNKHVDIPN